MVSLRHWAIVACFLLCQESATFGKVGVQSRSDVNHENLSMFRRRIYLLTKNNSIFEVSSFDVSFHISAVSKLKARGHGLKKNTCSTCDLDANCICSEMFFLKVNGSYGFSLINC